MCRRNSRGSKDIGRFRNDVLPDKKRKRFACHKFHGPVQKSFKELGKRYEAIEAFLAGNEFDQEIDIAVGARLAAGNGSEKREALHAERADLGLGGPDPPHHVGELGDVIAHTGQYIRLRFQVPASGLPRAEFEGAYHNKGSFIVHDVLATRPRREPRAFALTRCDHSFTTARRLGLDLFVRARAAGVDVGLALLIAFPIPGRQRTAQGRPARV